MTIGTNNMCRVHLALPAVLGVSWGLENLTSEANGRCCETRRKAFFSHLKKKNQNLFM